MQKASLRKKVMRRSSLELLHLSLHLPKLCGSHYKTYIFFGTRQFAGAVVVTAIHQHFTFGVGATEAT